MIRIKFSPRCKRHIKRRADQQLQRILRGRLTVLANDPHVATLRNHALKGPWKGLRSIDITKDYRAIFQDRGNNKYLFVDFGTHDQLYR